MFIVEIEDSDDVETCTSPEAAWEFVSAFSGSYRVDITVYKDAGSTENADNESLYDSASTFIPYLDLIKEGPVAAICLSDSYASEYWAIDDSFQVEVDIITRQKLSHGEPTPLDTELCLSANTAFRAAREFLLSGLIPNWLRYRYVQ